MCSLGAQIALQAASHREEALIKEIKVFLENKIRLQVDVNNSTNRSVAMQADAMNQRVLVHKGQEALTSLQVRLSSK